MENHFTLRVERHWFRVKLWPPFSDKKGGGMVCLDVKHLEPEKRVLLWYLPLRVNYFEELKKKGNSRLFLWNLHLSVDRLEYLTPRDSALL